MKLSGKIVGGIAAAVLLVAASQFSRDRDRPEWTVAAVSTATPNAESDRVSTHNVGTSSAPIASKDHSETEQSPARVLQRSVDAIRIAASEGRDDGEPHRDRRMEGTPSNDAPEAAPLKISRTVEAAENPEASAAVSSSRSEREFGNRTRKARQPRRPGVRSGRCENGCYARSLRRSLPSRRDPIQFRLADRGSR
jgi:hypothetical protein